MLLVDTNVLVDVLQNDPQWADWSIAQLRARAKLHALVINPVIYAEMSLSFSTLEALDDVVSTMELELREIPRHRGDGARAAAEDRHRALRPRPAQFQRQERPAELGVIMMLSARSG